MSTILFEYEMYALYCAIKNSHYVIKRVVSMACVLRAANNPTMQRSTFIEVRN